MYYSLVVCNCSYFFQFSTLAIACLLAFVILARLFLERAIHTFISSQLFQSRSYNLCVLFRLACFYNEPYMHLSVPNSVFQPRHVLIRYVFIVSAHVFLERLSHECIFLFPPQLFKCYFGTRHVFRTSHACTCVLPFRSQLFQPHAYQLFNYYFGSRIFRTSHTCVIPLLFRLTC